ncbi:MAG: hypothetical protein LBC07_06510 [Elusimicrobiota bacterium]|nr:hypothetical protein [Elusimicrobiota bacterium]
MTFFVVKAQADVDTWNNFVTEYRQKINYGEIILEIDLSAPEISPSAIGSPTNNNITIDGKNKTLNSNAIADLGFILNAKTMTFKDINFYNFLKTADSGAVMSISNNAIVTFLGNIDFSSNSNSGYNRYGGAISASDSNISFVSSLVDFTSNSAYYGGAIYANNNSTISFTNSSITFTNNSSNYAGGAIYVLQSSLSFVNSSITFTGNGGAIYAYNSSISFANSLINFTSNSGYYYAGAIFADSDSNISFFNSSATFTSNSANGGHGGAISANDNSNISFIRSTVNFTNNVVSGDASPGGAIHASQSSISFVGSLVNFTSNNSITNYHEGLGGAIYARGSNISFVNSLVNFTSNSVMDIWPYTYASGGAIFASDNSTISFVNSLVNFTSNSATSTYDAKGGAIYLSSSKLSITNSTLNFQDNFANGIRDDIYLVDSQSAVIFSSANLLTHGLHTMGHPQSKIVQQNGSLIFEGESKLANTFLIEGGTAHFKSAVSSVSVLTIYSTATLSLLNNSVDSKFYILGDFTLSGFLSIDVDFAAGKADNLFIEGIFTINISTLNLNILNQAKVSSIKIMEFNAGLNPNLSLDNLFILEPDYALRAMDGFIFLKNEGAIDSWLDFTAVYKNTAENDTITLDKNLKADAGGGDYIIGAPTNNNLTIDGANKTLDSNNFVDLGFSLDAKTLNFKNIAFNNFAGSGNGAVMNLSNNANVSFSGNISFTNNSANISGGAIYVSNSEINFQDSYITFKNNTAASTLNDVALDDSNAKLILTGNNTFTNGLRTSGAGEISINGNVTFSGDPSNIQNLFTINSGIVSFKSSGSTIKTLNILEDAVLSLQDSKDNNKLFIDDLNSSGIIEMDAGVNGADRIISNNITLGAANKFSLNLLTTQNFIVILAQSGAITGTPNSAEPAKYSIIKTGNNIFARSGDSTTPDQARVSAWNDFVVIYQNAMAAENDEIILMQNLTAQQDDDIIFQTNADKIFIVNGGGYALNAQDLENAFFDLQNKALTFKNISLANFKNTDQSKGGAINASGASTIHLNGNINFSNNFSGDKPNDINLQDENSVIIFDGNVTLANGIRSQGAGKLEKTSNGILNFQGTKSIIENDFNVSAGQLNFKSAVSSVNFLNMEDGTVLSLQDDKAGTKLYLGEIIMRSDLILDIDFKTAGADQIFASSITIYSGHKLTIKDLYPMDLTVNEVPIIIGGSSQTFTIFGESIFDYDRSLYVLRYSQNEGKLFIKNIKPNDIEEDNENSPNRQQVQEIANRNWELKNSLVKLSADKRRKAMDSLSGVFIVNILAAQTQGRGEILFNQIQREAAVDKIWMDVNYSVMEFSKPEQTLGNFGMIDMGIDIGRDLFGTRIGAVIARIGAYASANKKTFAQDENDASLNDFGFGVYENTNIGNFNLQFLGGLRYANVNASRIIKMDKVYNPISQFNIVSIDGALNLDYEIDMQWAKVGPFVLAEASQNSFKEISERSGEITDLTFNETSWTKAQSLIGVQIKSQQSFIDLFARGYVGLMLVEDPTFQVNFMSIEDSDMRIQSDRVNEMFYGAVAGINAQINKSITIGAMGYGQVSHSFLHYGVQLNAAYLLQGPRPKAPLLETPIESKNLSLKDKQAIKYFVKKLLHSRRSYKIITIKIYINVSQDEETKQIDQLKINWAQNVYEEMIKNGLNVRKVRVVKQRIKPITTNLEVRVDW